MSTPSPCPATQIKTLPEEINAATRQIHSHLNRLVITRLPLALPPFTDNPAVYAHGVSHFMQIYLTFESLWQQHIMERPGLQEPENSDGKILRILQHINLPALQRAPRLSADLCTLSAHAHLSPSFSSAASLENPRLREFQLHISNAVHSRPHVLVAYAWVMYMAIFSGGRWIRSLLSAAPLEFWGCDRHSKALPSVPTNSDKHPGLEFFYFDGAHDGEDIKTEFKQRLAEVEVLFTVEEKADIVEEALEIFRHVISLVEELDEQVTSRVTAPGPDNERPNIRLAGDPKQDFHPPPRQVAFLEKLSLDIKPCVSSTVPWLSKPVAKYAILWTFILLLLVNRYGLLIV